MRHSRPTNSFELDALESRQMLAWGTYPHLIRQDTSVSSFPSITGSGVNIAMIDSGVDFNQPNLAGKFWTNPGEIAGNGKDDDADGYVDDVNGWDFYRNDNHPEDENGHGTATAGIIASKSFTYNGATYAGLAPNAKIIELKVSDPTGAYSLGFSQRVEKALQWVETNYQRYNIRVVSMSIRATQTDYFNTYSDEVSRLASKGVLLIAAGAQEDPNRDVEYPARDPNVYGISVVRSNDTFPPTGVNRGPGIDLLAPGSGVPILLRGSGVTTSAEATSYSTPFASAAAALLLQLKPSLTPSQVMGILKNNGKNVTDTSTDYTYSGLTYKRLDVYAALVAAGATPPGASQTPYKGTPFVVDTKIQTEDFDNGGEGVAYHDTESANLGGQYRNNGIDIEPCGDKRGGYDVTLAKAGEWMEYTINVARTGNYTFNARVASKSKNGGFHAEIDGIDRTGRMVVPKTGSWQTWLAISGPTFRITAGQHVLRVAIDTNNLTGNGAGSFNWFTLTTAASAGTATAAPATSSPAVAPVVAPLALKPDDGNSVFSDSAVQ